MPRIKLDQVSLTFRIRPQGRITLKELFVKRMFRGYAHSITTVNALKDIRLEIRAGERIGVMGHNGAGKSTLLKLLAGIYPPTSGCRVVAGRISSLFEMTLGFEQDATGWENIAYRCYLQGETPKDVKDKVQPIADFSELGDFLNMPMRYYSSGMMLRLAFSIATAIEPEILLVDEILSVGDMAFQQKARQRMREMMDKAQLIVMVSHDPASLAAVCPRSIWLDHGNIRMDGPTEEVAAAYKQSAQPPVARPSHRGRMFIPPHSIPKRELCLS